MFFWRAFLECGLAVCPTVSGFWMKIFGSTTKSWNLKSRKTQNRVFNENFQLFKWCDLFDSSRALLCYMMFGLFLHIDHSEQVPYKRADKNICLVIYWHFWSELCFSGFRATPFQKFQFNSNKNLNQVKLAKKCTIFCHVLTLNFDLI